ARTIQSVGNTNSDGQDGPRHDQPDDPWTRMMPLQLAQPIVSPRRDSDREKEGITGKIPELQSNHVDAGGNPVANDERGGAHSQRAEQPPPSRRHPPRDARYSCQGRSCEPAPDAITGGEDQQGLREPE